MTFKGRSLPPPECRADPKPCPTEGEAEAVKDFIEMTDEHGGMLVVEYEGLFYVVYNEDYVGGYTDYETPG
jgi:hypothetical protein